MSGFQPKVRRPLSACMRTLLAAACLGLPGCSSWNLRGEGFRDDTAATVRPLRKPDSDIGFFGFSNKARDIERDLGAQ